jgi:hypothetical protein
MGAPPASQHGHALTFISVTPLQASPRVTAGDIE